MVELTVRKRRRYLVDEKGDKVVDRMLIVLEVKRLVFFFFF